jgi:type 1 glutamine amidotransferase
MTKKIPFLIAFFCCVLSSLQAAEPLRVFIRAGNKTHGPGAHDFPQFLEQWRVLLEQRGAVCDGGLEFPSQDQLDRTDVLVLHAEEAGNIEGEERKNLEAYLKRGGGLVVVHAGAVSRDPDWYKAIIGGSWRFGVTKWLEAPMSLYFTDRENPITRDLSNFDIDDEIYYDMELLPEVQVLAAAYTPRRSILAGRETKKPRRGLRRRWPQKRGSIFTISSHRCGLMKTLSREAPTPTGLL